MIMLTDRPPMTIAVDWDVKQQNKQTNKDFICSLFINFANSLDPVVYTIDHTTLDIDQENN